MEEVGLFYVYVARSAILIKSVNLKYVFLILFLMLKGDYPDIKLIHTIIY